MFFGVPVCFVEAKTRFSINEVGLFECIRTVSYLVCMRPISHSYPLLHMHDMTGATPYWTA